MPINPGPATGRRAPATVIARLVRSIGAIALISARRLGPAALG